MALKDIVIATKVVKFKGGEFTVGGLSFNDLTGILLNNESAVREAYGLFEHHVGGDLERGNAGLQAFGMALLDKLPELVAEIIAHAAGEPDMTATVLRLPAPVQLEALNAAAELTFEDADAVKKFMENLILAAKGTTDTLNAIRPMATIAPGSGSTKAVAKK